MPNALKITTLAVLISLSSCSAQQINSAQPELKLLPPDEGSLAVLLQQKVILQSGENRQQYLLVARFEKHRLKMVLLSPTGQLLLMLNYDGDELVQHTQSSIDVPGKEILAIIQFAMWPRQSIKDHYPEENGWRVEISPKERILLTATGVILKISFDDEVLKIDNYLHNYRVFVYTLEKTAL
jgi:hypothetical protein